VYYTEEEVVFRDAVGDLDSEIRDIAHINTKNETMNFFLEDIFPLAHNLLILIIVLLSLKTNLYVWRLSLAKMDKTNKST
jgi:hypothetical protein